MRSKIVHSYRASYGAGLGWQFGDEIEGLAWDTQMDLYMLPSLLEWPIEMVLRECLHSSIMKASVGSKCAVEDTVTDTQTDHFIITAVECFFQCLVTVASHARYAKREQQRSK